jgi:hypothetical protein
MPKPGGLLDLIRERTAMYTGERGLSAIYHFILGYTFAQRSGQTLSFDLPPDFNEWVAYRLHFRESTSGYRRMILNRIPDESVALDRFFELLDEHRVRHESVVATIHCHGPAVFRGKGGSPETKREAKVAQEVSLVVYTSDPGFFVIHDDQTAKYPRKALFCPSLSWLRRPYKPDADYVEIVDHDRYKRLLQDDEAFMLQIREEGEHKKK